MMRGQPERRRGFTLTELMVVLAIAGVLLAIGMPGLRDMILRQRLHSTAFDLYAALNLTRVQAIMRASRVIMMPADPLRADWTQGWVVFVDRNESLSLDAGDELIFRQGPVEPGITITSAFASSHPPFYIAYNGVGRSCSASNSMAARPGSLSLLLGRNRQYIAIHMLGRARICDPQVQTRNCGAD